MKNNMPMDVKAIVDEYSMYGAEDLDKEAEKLENYIEMSDKMVAHARLRLSVVRSMSEAQKNLFRNLTGEPAEAAATELGEMVTEEAPLEASTVPQK